MEWNVIWSQSIHRLFKGGRFEGKNKTVSFTVKAPLDGEQLRVQFSNRFGEKPCMVGAVTVRNADGFHAITVNGQVAFTLPAGGMLPSDAIPLRVQEGEELEVRLFYTSHVSDAGMIEEDAAYCKGNATTAAEFRAVPKSDRIIREGVFRSVPVISRVELLSQESAKAIVAFGDSITAMNRWVRPLQARLQAAYGGKYILQNAGINGNSLLYRGSGFFSSGFGIKGVERFAWDVLPFERLHAVILSIGINDVSYYTEKTKDIINFEAYKSAIEDLTGQLRERGVRVVIQTLAPRRGFPYGKYTEEMETLRQQINQWIRQSDLFDDIVDGDAVMRDPAVPDQCLEGMHQGDFLHPSAKGGQAIAEAFDLQKLTGEKE